MGGWAIRSRASTMSTIMVGSLCFILVYGHYCDDQYSFLCVIFIGAFSD